MSAVKTDAIPDEARALIGALATHPEKIHVLNELCTIAFSNLDNLITQATPELIKHLVAVRNSLPFIQSYQAVQFESLTNSAESEAIGIQIDPRVEELLGSFFNKVQLIVAGPISWELKEGVTAKEVVCEIDKLNNTLHSQSLLPSNDVAKHAQGYDSPSGSRTGIAVLGVPGTVIKDYYEMLICLNDANMTFSTRYNSIVSLNLSLLITGQNPFKPHRSLRDLDGVLDHSENLEHPLVEIDYMSKPKYSSGVLYALGSPNGKAL